MYRAFYGLTCNPFSKDIPVQRLYKSANYKQFVGRMEYFKQAKGFAVVYGLPGVGKTTALRVFTATLNPQLYRVVYLPLSILTVREFYRNLAMGLGLIPMQKKVDMFHQIQDQIINFHHQKKQTPFIILDEGQFLGGSVLNELRMLFNFQMDSQNHAMVLICAQPVLVNQLNLHIHEPLRQRITVHHEFTGLPKEEVGECLTTLLASAGLDEPLFTPDPIEALSNACQGRLRVICSTAEKALILGAQKQLRQLDSSIILAAHEEANIYAS